MQKKFSKNILKKKHGIFWIPYEMISIPQLESQLSKAPVCWDSFISFLLNILGLVIKIKVQPDPKQSSSQPYPFTVLVTVEDTLAVKLKAIGTFVHAFKHRRGGLTHHWDAAALLPGSILQAL